MPHELDLNGPLTQEMIQRVIKEPEPKEFDLGLEKGPEFSTISPDLALLMGGLADAGSTYNFLKNKTGTESNAIAAKLGNNQPGKTAALAAGTTLGTLLLKKLLEKKFPKVADTLAGGLGGYQMTVAADNLGPASVGNSEAETLNMNRINNQEESRLPSRLPRSLAPIPFRKY